MANTKQALKRVRQAKKHRQDNQWQMSRMKRSIKNVLLAIEKKEGDEAKTAYQKASSTIDKLVTKGLIHKNKASRFKSRLNKRLVALLNAA